MITADDGKDITDAELIKQYESLITEKYGEKDDEPVSLSKCSWTLDGYTIKILSIIDGLVVIEFTSDAHESNSSN